MAEIFRGHAIGARGFVKPVAIKRILPTLSQDKHFVELLIAEANIVSHLRHRNIVQIFDVGLGPDGQYFLVMEYVEGLNLGALQKGLEVQSKRLPLGLGLYIGAEICDALEHAYNAPGPDGNPLKLVHRDVSPTNVLLSRNGEVKLTDFGIAKRVEDVTSHGGVRGKFAYISPEQASSMPVDARSDVFSVGILLFEMLLGTRLYSQMADFDALRAVVEGQVPTPRIIDRNIDRQLEAILLKALAHNPDHRYRGADELGKELRGFRYSLPDASGDPALELANTITYFSTNRAPSGQGIPERSDGDDFLNNTGTFTLTGDEGLPPGQSYAKARQVLDAFEEEETRYVRPLLQSGDSGEIAALLGAQPMVPEDSQDAVGELPKIGRHATQEETRVVDPYRQLSSAVPRDQAPLQLLTERMQAENPPSLLSETSYTDEPDLDAEVEPIGSLSNYAADPVEQVEAQPLAPVSDYDVNSTYQLEEAQPLSPVSDYIANVAHQVEAQPLDPVPDYALDRTHEDEGPPAMPTPRYHGSVSGPQPISAPPSAPPEVHAQPAHPSPASRDIDRPPRSPRTLLGAPPVRSTSAHAPPRPDHSPRPMQESRDLAGTRSPSSGPLTGPLTGPVTGPVSGRTTAPMAGAHSGANPVSGPIATGRIAGITPPPEPMGPTSAFLKERRPVPLWGVAAIIIMLAAIIVVAVWLTERVLPSANEVTPPVILDAAPETAGQGSSAVVPPGPSLDAGRKDKAKSQSGAKSRPERRKRRNNPKKRQ